MLTLLGYLFAGDPVINYHKLGGFDNKNVFIVLWFGSLEVWGLGMCRMVPFRGQQKKALF